MSANSQDNKDNNKENVKHKKTAVLSRTRLELIKTEDLLPSIKDNISKDYPGYKIN